MEQQHVVFNLGNEHFGVNITAVDSIIKMQEITKVSLVFDFVEGITNLRGAVLPIINLGKRLNLDASDVTNETRIVVVNIDSTRAGLIVDAVSEVLIISEETIEPTPTAVSSINKDFITGITTFEDRMIILLDLDRMFTEEEIEALQTI